MRETRTSALMSGEGKTAPPSYAVTAPLLSPAGEEPPPAGGEGGVRGPRSTTATLTRTNRPSPAPGEREGPGPQGWESLPRTRSGGERRQRREWAYRARV